MSPERKLAEALSALSRRRETHKLEHYKPYPWQINFHNVHGYKTDKPAVQRAAMCANQVGKCVHVGTRIPHPDGSSSTVAQLVKRNRPFGVWSWDGERLVESVALPPFSKPAETIYRIYLDSGDWFDCAGEHRVLSQDGWQHVSRFLPSLRSLPLSTLERGLLTHAEGVRRWSERLQGFLADCLLGFRSCGERLRSATGNALAFAPSQGDVQKRNLASWQRDVWGRRCTNSAQPSCGLPSSSYGLRRIVGRCVEFLALSSGSVSGWCFGSIRKVWRFSRVAVARLQLGAEGVQGQSGQLAYLVTPGNCANKIIAYSVVGVHPVYDFTVPDYRNYFAEGALHHNTTAGGMEVAIHATGIYPSWWKGNRFTKPINVLVGGLTNESVRDICQKELFGEPTDDKQMGTGAVPIDKIGKSIRKAGVPNALDSVQVKHVSGGWSKISFRAYEQGAKKHMGSRIDLGWLDEEPPEDIWAQYLRGTLATRGILFITFTPEEGMTKVVYGFVNDIKPGQALVRATWDDAPHMNHDRREQMLLAIPTHQREMRAKGIPLRGSGLVYQVQQADIECDAFDIPAYWPRVVGVDFGIGHDFAAVWFAWDRERDVAYVVDCWKKPGEKISEHVSQLNRRGNWIPVIWPHDGLQRDPKSGEPLAEEYRKEGANMWHEQFSNPPVPGVDEGKGGNSVEFGVEHILHRMQTGRFKVFKNLQPWFVEWMDYHRDEGKIVKQYDDLMDATRYACLSLRHATTQTLRIKKAQPPLGLRNW